MNYCDSSNYYEALSPIKFLNWRQKYALEAVLEKKGLTQAKNGLKLLGKTHKDPRIERLFAQNCG